MAKDRTKANGEGTIYKRGKGYCGQYHVVARDGTKKRRSVYGKTRAQAAEKLAAAIAERDRGLTFDAGTLTVGEHLDGYLEDAKGRLRRFAEVLTPCEGSGQLSAFSKNKKLTADG